MLREIAQTPDEDVDAFQDTARHRYFNTNTLWVDLRALADGLAGARRPRAADDRQPQDGRPGGRRRRPRSSSSRRRWAPRSASSRAPLALRVPRTRFAPVKTTNDLLALRSDAYVLDEALARARSRPSATASPPLVDLDPRYYKLVDDFDARFPAGAAVARRPATR